MKLVTYTMRLDQAASRGPGGAIARVGAIRGEQVIDLSSVATSMIFLLQGGQACMDTARRIVETAEPSAAMDDVSLLAPIPWPPKILALAGNYQKHLLECGGKEKEKAKYTPQVFMKPGTCVLPPDGTVLRTHLTDQLDHEVELCVVIGRTAKKVDEKTALECIAGYTITNDISSRRLINLSPTREVDARGKWFDWLMGKWQDTALPMGPCIVTRDELGAADNLPIRLSVNGEVRQDANTADMIYSAPEIVSFISRFLTLQPGDVISTGTPAGVGMGSGKYLRPGDRIAAYIENIGELCNNVGEEV